MARVDYRNIEKKPGVCGGRAVIVGTRIRASLILGWHRDGYSIEEILQMYPHLKPADVHDAMAYALDHPIEMEEDLAADDEELVMQQWSHKNEKP